MTAVLNTTVKLVVAYFLLLLMSVGALFAQSGLTSLNKQSIRGQRAWELWNHYQAKDAEWQKIAAAREKAPDKDAFDNTLIGDYEETALDSMKFKTRIQFDFRGMSKLDRALALMSLVFEDDKTRPRLKNERKIIYFPDGASGLSFGEYFRAFDFEVNAEKLSQDNFSVRFDTREVQVSGSTIRIAYTGVSGDVRLSNPTPEKVKQLFQEKKFNLDFELKDAASASALKALVPAGKSGIDVQSFRVSDRGDRANLRVVIPPMPLKISNPSQKIMIVTQDDRHLYANSVNDISVSDLRSARVIAVGGMENLKALVKRLNEEKNQAAIDLFKSKPKTCTPA